MYLNFLLAVTFFVLLSEFDLLNQFLYAKKRFSTPLGHGMKCNICRGTLRIDKLLAGPELVTRQRLTSLNTLRAAFRSSRFYGREVRFKILNNG